MRPFCHLVIKTVRVDSPPLPATLSKSLMAYHLDQQMTLRALAKQLEISLGTLKNWQSGRTHPNRKSWPTIRAILGT